MLACLRERRQGIANMVLPALVIFSAAAALLLLGSALAKGVDGSAVGLARATAAAMGLLSVVSGMLVVFDDRLGDRVSYLLFGASASVFFILCGLLLQAVVPMQMKRFASDSKEAETATLVGRWTGRATVISGIAIFAVAAWLAAFPP